MFKQLTVGFLKQVSTPHVRSARSYSKNLGAAQFVYEQTREQTKDQQKKSESEVKEELQRRQVIQCVRPLKIMRGPYHLVQRHMQQQSQQQIRPQAHSLPQPKPKMPQLRSSLPLTAQPQPKQQKQQIHKQQLQLQKYHQQQQQQQQLQQQQLQQQQKISQRQSAPQGLQAKVQALRQEMQLKQQQQQQQRMPPQRLPVPKPMPISLQKMSLQKPLPSQPMMPLPMIRKITESPHKPQLPDKPINESEKKDLTVQGFGREIIMVADAVGTAIKTIPSESRKIPFIRSVFEGLRSIENLLTQTLERHGFRKISPLQERFDPSFHEAIKTRQLKGIKPNIVIEVGRVGYKHHERCIRPALVVVSE